ncbi:MULTISPECIES: hypothetical protein [unclassified Microbacterium]|uniref:hypothetical protein n=1 Tax=unclassified Microbacterium TaxID=2609290 RepID=UPI000CFC4FDF|nr:MULTISPECIES: hypothetical protein [unclassified Microbacterium]PRB10580.1 hypothetical protein CQ047_07270 [Microbacterium sp. MYb72]
MTDSRAAELRDLTNVRAQQRRDQVRRWLDENDEYRLDDVTYAISVMQLSAADDRDTMTGLWTLTALGAALWAIVASFGAETLIGHVAGVVVVFALLGALWASGRVNRRQDVLLRLLELVARAPRRTVRPWRFSRQGQVYLAPER